MKRVVFAPSNGGAITKQLWLPSAENKLESLGIEVAAAEFPDPELARTSY